MYLCVCVCMYVCMYVYSLAFMSVRMHACVLCVLCVGGLICMHARMYVWVFLCVYVCAMILLLILEFAVCMICLQYDMSLVILACAQSH
jgi:hypothetical protein